jgi:hypothetical protein
MAQSKPREQASNKTRPSQQNRPREGHPTSESGTDKQDTNIAAGTAEMPSNPEPIRDAQARQTDTRHSSASDTLKPHAGSASKQLPANIKDVCAPLISVLERQLTGGIGSQTETRNRGEGEAQATCDASARAEGVQLPEETQDDVPETAQQGHAGDMQESSGDGGGVEEVTRRQAESSTDDVIALIEVRLAGCAAKLFVLAYTRLFMLAMQFLEHIAT